MSSQVNDAAKTRPIGGYRLDYVHGQNHTVAYCQTCAPTDAIATVLANPGERCHNCGAGLVDS